MPENLMETMQALMARPEPGSAPAPAAAPEPALSNANTPTHIGAAPAPAPVPAPAPAPAPFPAPPAAQPNAAPAAAQPNAAPAPAPQPQPLTYEELAQRHDNLKAALAEARGRSRTLERSLAESNDARVRVENDLRTVLARVAAQAQQPAAPAQGGAPAQVGPIDVNSIARDPLAAVQQLATLANAMLAEREQAQHMNAQQQQVAMARAQAQRQEVARMQSAALALEDSEMAFREYRPDYDNAAQHYVNARIYMLEAAGHPRENAVQAVQWELLQSTHVAISQGVSPAQAIYQAAVAMGYAPGGMPTPAPTPAPAPAPAPTPAPAQPDPLQHIRNGQAAALSVSGGTAPTNAGPLDLSSITSLNGAAFTSAATAFLRQVRGLDPQG